MALVWTFTDLIVNPGDPIDAEVYAELKSNILQVAALAGPAKGTSTFAGPTGKAITITAQADVAYLPIIQPLADPGGNLGEVWVVVDSITQFTVYNSGSAVTAFGWKVVR
jgi:hypothetical protein